MIKLPKTSFSKVITQEPEETIRKPSPKENPTTPVQISYLTLRLKKKVKWTEDTIDNEHMNKKKSNICCIFKKPILNPDDSDSSSCESCDEKGKNAYERPNHYERKKLK